MACGGWTWTASPRCEGLWFVSRESRVHVRIERKSGKLNTTIPGGTIATVTFPDGRTEEVTAGKHPFAIPTGEQ